MGFFFFFYKIKAIKLCIFRNNKVLTMKKFIGNHMALLLVLCKNPNYITHIYLLMHKANQLTISLLSSRECTPFKEATS